MGQHCLQRLGQRCRQKHILLKEYLCVQSVQLGQDKKHRCLLDLLHWQWRSYQHQKVGLHPFPVSKFSGPQSDQEVCLSVLLNSLSCHMLGPSQTFSYQTFCWVQTVWKWAGLGFLSASMKKTSSLSTTKSRLRSVAVLLLFCSLRCTLWRLCSRSKHFEWYLAFNACMSPSESFHRRILSWRVTAYSRTLFLSMENVRALNKVSLVSSPLQKKTTTLRPFKTLTRHLASFHWTFVVFFTTLKFFGCPQCSFHFLIVNFCHELNKAYRGS